MDLSVLYFLITGILAIASAVACVSSKNPLVSAMSLVLHFFMLAGIYLSLSAQFLAVMQILVYAGAIMVLVIFVIMLLNMGSEEALRESVNVRKVVAVTFSVILISQLVLTFVTLGSSEGKISELAMQNGTAEALGKELYSTYLFPFEAIALLLLVAVIGALVLARRKSGSLVKY